MNTSEEKKKINHKRLTIRNIIKRGIFITIGAIIMAYGLEGVLIPNNIIDGGVTGLSMILSHVTAINLSLFLVILNLPFFFLGYKQIGKTFAISMLYGIVALSVATSFMHHIQPVVENELLAVVFGGLILGVGVGLTIRNGGVLDGTETLAILVEKRLPFSVGEIIMFVNVIIFSIAAFVFSLENALFSMLTYYVAFRTIDIVVKGLDDMKSVYIISDNTTEIADAITERLGRGVTYLHGEGSYSGEDKRVILCVFTRLEETKLKDIIRELDPQAFTIATDVSSVHGGRFKKKDIH
ncbi:YitT family protein [Brevibacillus choshinensis]|uniref:YitT family protein n=1 Tax=Brevibacillus choshinensis TaxID=54911 RepID=UPI002E2100E8|nr:YitT family protein [Brevibacillus choshinensis]MED4749838.1 YitT family protein [Brevibacillus choshinensis]MED4780503.1 YitT family protein [Brevibacillus choshinensis]